MATTRQTNYLSIDVEDYFQVSAFESISPLSRWDSLPMRVERNTEIILNVLAERQTKATFFTLGWIAARCPHLVQRIAAAGHEIASHGYCHQRVTTISRSAFRKDICVSKKLLEDLTGQRVQGYRAPSYTISRETPWAFDELLEAGYSYDSSIFPVRHDFYGLSDWPRFSGWAVKNGSGEWEPAEDSGSIRQRLFEVPITTLQLGKIKLPIAGGGYFRFFPYPFTRWGLRRINQAEGRSFVFYLHPWEFDPEQPQMAGASRKSRFRHYLNLDKTEGRFRRLLTEFSFSPVCKALEAHQAKDPSLVNITATAKPTKSKIDYAHTSG